MATHVFLTAALFAGASLARAAAPVKVTSVEEKGGKLFIHATAKPEFTVFKLSGPPRVVIDLNGGDVTAVQSGGHHSMVSPAVFHRDGIAGWSAAQFDEGDTRALLFSQYALRPAGEAGLGAADRGQVQQHAEVGGDAEATRVRDPLSIYHDKVRPPREPPNRSGRVASSRVVASGFASRFRGRKNGLRFARTGAQSFRH